MPLDRQGISWLSFYAGCCSQDSFYHTPFVWAAVWAGTQAHAQSSILFSFSSWLRKRDQMEKVSAVEGSKLEPSKPACVKIRAKI